MTYSCASHGVWGAALPYAAMVQEEETMGQRVSRLMESKGLSQAAVARALGCSRMTVNQWVHDVSEPRPEHLLSLSELLGTDPFYLVFGPSRRSPSRGGAPSSVGGTASSGPLRRSKY